MSREREREREREGLEGRGLGESLSSDERCPVCVEAVNGDMICPRWMNDARDQVSQWVKWEETDEMHCRWIEEEAEEAEEAEDFDLRLFYIEMIIGQCDSVCVWLCVCMYLMCIRLDIINCTASLRDEEMI